VQRLLWYAPGANKRKALQRIELYVMIKNGDGVNEIARALGRAGSTITNELKRNTVDERIGYLPDDAHRLALECKAKHGLKITRRPELKAMVVEQLKESWSPEIIAGRQKQQAFPFFGFL